MRSKNVRAFDLPRRILLGLIVSLVVVVPSLASAKEEKPITVFAAASLTEALNDAATLYAKSGHPKPVFNFSASSNLARQIEQGARADLFFSADEPWMDYLADRALIDAKSRVSLLSNTLVLVAPASSPFSIAIKPNMNLAAALNGGKLSMADPDSVPAGKYGKAALQNLGVWNSVSGAVVRAENVRAALRFVETGDAAAGIVYGTDAKASSKVVVAGVFPELSHPKISYPAAVVKGPREKDAADFQTFLRSPDAAAIFKSRGFIIQ